MTDNLKKFRDKLKEIFQLHQADLDFGIYRILNVKREEILSFLDKDLLPQVQTVLDSVGGSKKASLQDDLRKAEENAKALGMKPEDTPKVQELRDELTAYGGDNRSVEQEVFAHLYNFFSRYYKEGDFISLRRYKEGVYAIPYEGEEVKLYWANHDQYYIKTGEQFKDYAFKVADGRRVHFKLLDAVTEKDNVKAVTGKERRFIYTNRFDIDQENGELNLYFVYQPDSKGRSYAELNDYAVETILSDSDLAAWKAYLGAPAPSPKNPKRTLLEKHLTNYAARNTFDYFIHKDLGGFLNRELDFFIKSEVMHLDDVENIQPTKYDSLLAKVKAVRQIAHKIITFVAQMEEFQKSLWLKKKFVVESNYCITLDRIPEELYPEIAANDAQRAEWVDLFAIDKLEPVKGDLIKPDTPGYSEPLTVEFLQANNTLLLDTKFFDWDFVQRLTASIEGFDEQCDGVLVYSENFQALNLLRTKYFEQVKCVYIDPPYNTDVSSIPYKNDYRHSSWGTLMRDRLALLREMLKTDGATFVSIDKTERSILEYALDSVFGAQNKVEELIWIQNTNDGRSPTYSTNHEYVEVYAKGKEAVENDHLMFREPKPGFAEVMSLLRELNSRYPSLEEVDQKLNELFKRHKKEYKASVLARGLDWEKEKRNDPWRGTYAYQNSEYRDADGCFVPEEQAKGRGASLWVYQEDNWTIMSSDSKQSGTTKDPNHKNYRYYEPIHPVTGKPCKLSSRGWKGTQFIDPEHPDRKSFESLMNDHRIAFGPDENKVPREKRFLHEVDTNVCKSVFVDYADGEKEVTAMFGRSGLFLAPKHSGFVSRFIEQSNCPNGVVVDCFGGSGSTGDAVIKTNQSDDGNRKYVLIEMGKHFETLLKPRMQKAIYSRKWKKGKPTPNESGGTSGMSHCFKYLRLESYEDTLDNLQLVRRVDDDLLSQHDGLREEYMLGYMLDMESRGSDSLLNIDRFSDPFNYKLKIRQDDELQETTVDLLETFNWLIGLRVSHIAMPQTFTADFERDDLGKYQVKGRLKQDADGPWTIRKVEGEAPDNSRVLILWRTLTGDIEQDNAVLDAWFQSNALTTQDTEFDLVYVNGDNNLPNLKRPDDTWKVRLLEEEFHKRMWTEEG